jgi:hypothetical protein
LKAAINCSIYRGEETGLRDLSRKSFDCAAIQDRP